MIWEELPNIPRLYTGIAEWAACLVYVVLVSRRKPILVGVISAVSFVVLVGWQLIAGTLPDVAWVGGMLASAALMGLFILIGTGLNARDSAYLCARAFVLAELTASLQWQIHTFAESSISNPIIGGSPWFNALSVVVMYSACCLIAFYAERRHISRSQALAVDGRSLVFAFAIAAATFLVSNLSFVSPNTPFSGRAGLEIFYIRTLVDIAGFVALYAQQGQRMESRRAVELQATTILLNAQHEQYLQSQRNIDQVNRKYHDLKHYIAAIRAEASEEKRSAFLDQLEDSIRGYEYEVNTGNPVVDAILGPKLARCKELGITVACVVDGKALEFIDTMSLSALLGNALDNAIEAAAQVPQEQRLLKLTAFRKNSFVLIRVENQFRGSVEIVDGIPVSTKDVSLGHGFGTKNMKSVVESYGGSLSIRAEDQWFTVLVLLPIPK